ncbi:hypothetical protein L873DRAFT_980213 [Choiromyces venosus 120613-1]|uniref:Uncharacterized protein n=1 Tax=Choiromyces venosus 120613-1 TaxID=1336337 RepID=A0A3N4JL67_9PEZI|nr:hypothetical protein L873DRAFT_980213 [Choiromyces venosus 120613-1]
MYIDCGRVIVCLLVCSLAYVAYEDRPIYGAYPHTLLRKNKGDEEREETTREFGIKGSYRKIAGKIIGRQWESCI